MTSRTSPEPNSRHAYSTARRARRCLVRFTGRRCGRLASRTVSMTGGSPSLPRQPAHRRLHGGGERVGCLVPHPVEQLFRWHDPPGGGQQALQQRELPRAEVQSPSRARRGVPARVEGDVAVLQDGWHGGCRAPGQGPDPGDQLGEVKRLSDVVVRAEPEAVDLVADSAGGRQHQHPAAGVPGDDPAAHLVAVDDGQVAVQDHHVVAGAAEAVECFLPVQGEVHGHALTAQPGGDRRGEHFVILYDKQSHRLQDARPQVPARCQPPAPR